MRHVSEGLCGRLQLEVEVSAHGPEPDLHRQPRAGLRPGRSLGPGLAVHNGRVEHWTIQVDYLHTFIIEDDYTFVVFIADFCSVLDKVSYFKTLEEKQIERTV